MFQVLLPQVCCQILPLPLTPCCVLHLVIHCVLHSELFRCQFLLFLLPVLGLHPRSLHLPMAASLILLLAFCGWTTPTPLPLSWKGPSWRVQWCEWCWCHMISLQCKRFLCCACHGCLLYAGDPLSVVSFWTRPRSPIHFWCLKLIFFCLRSLPSSSSLQGPPGRALQSLTLVVLSPLAA